MAQNLIDILIRTRRTGAGEAKAAAVDLKQIDSAANAAAGGLAGLAAGAGIAGIIALGRELDELARRGAVFEQLGSVLESYAASVGTNSQAMIDAAKKASAGTISEYELILNANRAIQFEVANSAESYAKLIELSTALGRAQGISDSTALEYLTTGLARESKLILDNLGLIIDIDAATAQYAATLGKSAEQLTQAERKQALLDEAFSQGTVAIEANRAAAESSATQYERFDASVQNLKDSFGQFIADNAVEYVSALASEIERLNERLKGDERNVDGVKRDIQALQELRDTVAAGEEIKLFGFDITGKADLLADLDQRLKNLNQQVFISAAAQYDMAGASQQAAELSMQAANAFVEQENAAKRAALGLAEAEAAAHAQGRAAALAAIDNAVLIDSLDKLAGSSASAIMNAAKGVTDIVGGDKAKDLAKQQLRYLQEQTLELERQGLTGLDLTFAFEEIKNESLAVFENIEDADAAARKAAAGGVRAMNKEIKDAAKEAERLFDELKGKVGGILGEALDPGVGVDVNALLKTGVKVPDGEQPKPEDYLLPRGDAVNEDARRLADIAVKGFESPWYEYFRTEFPALFQEFFAGATDGDGVRAQAAQLLQNFQDGLNPQLIDKDTAKERVRRMLIGEQRMDQLAQEIAEELSAEFGGLGQGQIADLASRALGGSGIFNAPNAGDLAAQFGGAASTAFGAFESGVKGAVTDGDLGSQVTAALDNSLRAESNLARLAEGGRLSGAAWGNGFMESVGEGVPGPLINLLSVLVTPGVEAALLQRASQMGARP